MCFSVFLIPPPFNCFFCLQFFFSILTEFISPLHYRRLFIFVRVSIFFIMSPSSSSGSLFFLLRLPHFCQDLYITTSFILFVNLHYGILISIRVAFYYSILIFFQDLFSMTSCSFLSESLLLFSVFFFLLIFSSFLEFNAF